MASDFWEAYRDPRWQKKRLEVMDAANFTCQECYAKDVTLHVHHKFYRRKAKPWEYAITELRCLCENCHGTIQERDTLLRQMIGELTSDHAEAAYGYLSGLILQQRALNGDWSATVTLAKDEETAFSQAMGLVQAYGGDAWNICIALDENRQIGHETICTLWREFDEANGIEDK